MIKIKSLLIKIIIKCFLIILILLLICLSIITILYKNDHVNKSDVKKIFENKFYFELPLSAEIKNSDYIRKNKCLYIKALFDSNDYDYLIDNIEYYWNNGSRDIINNKETIPYFKNICYWWDMNLNQIIYAHTSLVSYSRFFYKYSKPVYVFITQDSKDQYCLYVVH